MCKDKTLQQTAVFVLVAVMIFIPLGGAGAQDKKDDLYASGREVTLVITTHPHNDRAREYAAHLSAEDFAVYEKERKQQIISVKPAAEMPPMLAVLIQDDLVARVNNELNGIKTFIRGLPQGSRVMTGYISAGSLRVAKEFSTDLERAAGSLHILRSSTAGSPFNPYIEVTEALHKFDSQPKGRRMILLVSDGLDSSRGFRASSPGLSPDLDRSIREAQRRGVSIFTIYSPSIGLTSISRMAANFGQGSLNRLSDETGGESFSTGIDFVSFAPYLKEFKGALDRQYVLTYRSSNTGSDYRKIRISTETGVHLQYMEGYNPKDSDVVEGEDEDHDKDHDKDRDKDHDKDHDRDHDK